MTGIGKTTQNHLRVVFKDTSRPYLATKVTLSPPVMAGALRMSAFPRLYSRIAGRQIYTSAVRQYRPVPTTRPAYASELEALQAKEKGPWGELTKQEKIDRKFLGLQTLSYI